jgi:hypothetical protein
MKETMTVVGNEVAGKYREVPADFEKNFRYRVKRWALSFDYYSMMQTNMLLDPNGSIGRNASKAAHPMEAMIAKIVSGELELAEALERVAQEDRPEFLKRMIRGEGLSNALEYLMDRETLPEEELCAELRAVFERNKSDQDAILNVLARNPNEANVAFVQGLFGARYRPTVGYYDEALRLLKDSEDPRTIEIFRKAMGKSWSSTHGALEEILAERSDAASFELIKQAVASRDVEVQKFGLSILASRDGEGAFEVLQPLLTSRDTEVKTAAIRALGNKSDPRATEQMKKYLVSANPEVKAAALDALEKATSPGAVDLILAEVKTHGLTDYRYRRLLAQNRSPEWASKLAATYRARGTTQEMKKLLLGIAGNLSDPETLRVLEEASASPTGTYVEEAISALTQREDSKAKTILRRYRRDARYKNYRWQIDNALRTEDDERPSRQSTRETSERPERPRTPRTVEEYLRQNGTLRGIPCRLLLQR